VRSEKLVAEARESWGTSTVGSSYQKTGSEDFVCTVVTYGYEGKCPINPITNSNPVYRHSSVT
jgi:hypothetical protein